VLAAPREEGLRVGCVEAGGAPLSPGYNLAREPRDTLDIAGRPVRWGDAPMSGDVLTLYGAMLRTAQMAGALDAILELAVTYANQRVQFGRPIGQFQVIQQELARLAGLVAAAGSAAEAAARAASEATDGFTGVVGAAGDPTLEIAAAKVVGGDAAEHGPRIAHQVHGAIGFTYEHSLHFATRRLWSWRAEFGGESHWAAALGRHVTARGADALWPDLTAIDTPRVG
jgi:acyl-CoA dehydrogenase